MSPKIKNNFINFIAWVLSFFGVKNLKHPKPDYLKRAEFKTSTQRLGVRFNEKIRDVFRFKWLRKKDN